MNSFRNPGLPAARGAALATLLALAGCGGGGGSPADVVPGPEPNPIAETEPNKFLLFPNPQQQPDGSLQTTTQEYAEAYYRAIDPNNERDTLAKYKAKNGFETGTGNEWNVIFGDRRDLGYGRRMYVRQNLDKTMAFYVENYLIQAGPAYAYSPLNLDAAIVRDSRWHVGTNAIEFSPGPEGDARTVHLVPRRAGRCAHARGRDRQAALQPGAERRLAAARRRPGAPASLRARCLRLLRHAGRMVARGAGSQHQGDQRGD